MYIVELLLYSPVKPNPDAYVFYCKTWEEIIHDFYLYPHEFQITNLLTGETKIYSEGFEIKEAF